MTENALCLPATGALFDLPHASILEGTAAKTHSDMPTATLSRAVKTRFGQSPGTLRRK